jgi:hypothetical protein
MGRLARDFVPMPVGVADRPGVQRCFRQLSVLWGALNLVTAMVTFWLPLHRSLAVFMLAKTLSSFGITATGVALTVGWSLRTARAENLAFAPARGALPAPDAQPIRIGSFAPGGAASGGRAGTTTSPAGRWGGSSLPPGRTAGSVRNDAPSVTQHPG